MTRFILICCIPLIWVSCTQNNVLHYKHREYFKEASIITSDSVFKLYQRVFYDKPSIMDEEFWYYISLTFVDTTEAKTKRILDLQTDTSIVKVKYGVFSIWNWSDENNLVSGQIEILKWAKDEVRLKENIQVIDYRRNQTKRFVGKRTFRPKEGW